MASFEQHLNTAVIVTGILIAPLHSADFITTQQAFIVLSLGLIGGILPDLDSDHSKPVKIVFKILSIFFPLLIIVSLAKNLPIFQIIIIWFVSGMILQQLFSQFFLKQTVHRGLFHTIPMGVLFAQLTLLLFFRVFQYDLKFSTIAAVFLFMGFMIHLLLDEFSSINALGLTIKKSFGTAFKLYARRNILGTLILYSMIIGLFMNMPIDNSIYPEILAIIKNIQFF
jgi:hypothetical protein